MKPFTIAISPCPNDTFAFYAWINKQIPHMPLCTASYHDIEELNNLSLSESADIIKISVSHFKNIQDKYDLLNVGATLGEKTGPLVVSNDLKDLSQLKNASIVFPGKTTTAYWLYNHLIGKPASEGFCIYNDIESKVLNGEYQAGTVIHETRFSLDPSLNVIADLGELFYTKYQLPVPLGAIAIKKSLHPLKETVEKALSHSIEYALSNPIEPMLFMKKYAQDTSEEVISQHIDLYINQRTLKLDQQAHQVLDLFRDNSI